MSYMFLISATVTIMEKSELKTSFNSELNLIEKLSTLIVVHSINGNLYHLETIYPNRNAALVVADIQI